MKPHVLDVSHATMQFGGLIAVNDLCITIDSGEIVALIGPNGAGKTTAFNMITGMVSLSNLNITGMRPDRIASEDIEYIYTLFPRLQERSWQIAGTLSGGEQQMLAVGRALTSKPKLLMMDEPSLGLAPLVVKDIFAIIRKIRENGVTVLLIEQNANAALKIADYGYVLETGSIALEGEEKELLTNPEVRAAYLGKD
ncbi:MAG: ATP-binding cassette domain-containing protein [Clostridiales bacterium]|nr:ATP-binding cassette domain-containing protein [Clostridiales bacterium]